MINQIRNFSKKVLSNNWYTLYKIDFEIEQKNGTWLAQSREAYDRGNGAVIMLYNIKKNTVILIKQFRMPTYVNGNADGMLIEACAGLLDADRPEDCIRKETEEETGYRIQDVRKIYEAYMSPGSVTEILYFFIASYDDSQKINDGGGVEGEEQIDVLELPFADAMMMVEMGEIKDAKTIMLLQYLQIHGILKT